MAKIHKEITVTVPENIDYDRIFNMIPTLLVNPTDKQIQKLKESTYLFLHYLYPSRRYVKKYKKFNYYKKIVISDFRKITHCLDQKVITLLTNKNYPIVDINRSYQPTKFPRSYRLNQEFWYKACPPKKITIQSTISDNYLEMVTPKPILNNKGGEVTFGYLFNNYDKKFITIDQQVLTYIQDYEDKISIKLKDERGRTKRKFLENKIDITIKKMRTFVDNVDNGNFNVKMSKSNNRLYSEITNCYKELRNYLKINNNNISEIDIKNSHIYLLSIILNQKFIYNQEKEFSLFKIKNKLYNDLNTSFLKSKYYKELRLLDIKNKIKHINKYESSMLLYMLRLFDEKDVFEFKMMPFSDGIYDYINEVFFDNQKTIGSIKKNVMLFINMIYFRKYNLVIKELSAKFPNVNKIIEIFNGKENGGINLSILLQCVESYLLLEVGITEVLKIYPDLNFITVHDSIIVEEQFAQKVKNILSDSISSFTGSRIGLEIKSVGDPIENIKKSVDDKWLLMNKSYSKNRRKRRREKKEIMELQLKQLRRKSISRSKILTN